MAVFKLGVVLVTWPEGVFQFGRSTGWYHNYFCDHTKEGIARFWFEQSEGQLILEGEVFDWFPLDVDIEDLRKKPGENIVGRNQLVNKAIPQAKDKGFDETKYDGLVVVPNMSLPPGWSFDGGSGRYRQDGNDKPFSMLQAGDAFDFYAHEIGHQIGLDHSYGFNCYKNIDWSLWGEYGHFYCIMSASAYGGAWSRFNLPIQNVVEFQNVGPGLNGSSRLARGWASGIDFHIGSGGRIQQTLHSLGSSWAGNPVKVIHIIKSPEETYTVEFRSNVDRYDKGLAGPVVVINALRGSTADLGHPNTDSATYLGEIREAGKSFTSVARFRVELLAISAGKRRAEVRVSETAMPWHPWNQINPDTVFNRHVPVAALGRLKDHLDIFKVGFDGAVYSCWWHDDGQGWRPWSQIHPQTRFSKDAPVTALSRQEDKIDLFVPGLDGHVRSSWWVGDGQGWRPWFIIAPNKRFLKRAKVTAVSRRPDHIDLFAIDDGEVWSSWWHDDGEGWRPWFHVRPEKRFPGTTEVMAVARGSDHIDLFAIDDGGIVWSCWWHDDGQGWRPWLEVEPDTTFPNDARLSAVSRRDDHLDLFVVGTNGVAWSSWWHDDGQGWRPWFKIHPETAFERVSKVTALSRASNHIDLFVMDEDEVVWSSWWHEDGQGWRPWFRIHREMRFAKGAGVSVVSRDVEKVDLFVVGLDSVVWSTSWPLDAAQPNPHTTASPIYAIQANGDLWQYKHVGDPFGIPAWCKARKIGNGWATFKQVFSGGAGIIYAIQKDGKLLWYRHKGRYDASFSWDGPEEAGKKWHTFKQVFSDGGAIFAIKPDGTLLWYRHKGRHDGSFSWDGPVDIGNGWHHFKYVFAGGPGIIYGLKADGRLLWYRVSRDRKGKFSWVGPVEVRSDWQAYKAAFSDGRGLIYAIHNEGGLYWFKHLGFKDGRKNWTGPQLVGTGWDGLLAVFI